jgi:hypothetical protein
VERILKKTFCLGHQIIINFLGKALESCFLTGKFSSRETSIEIDSRKGKSEGSSNNKCHNAKTTYDPFVLSKYDDIRKFTQVRKLAENVWQKKVQYEFDVNMQTQEAVHNL